MLLSIEDEESVVGFCRKYRAILINWSWEIGSSRFKVSGREKSCREVGGRASMAERMEGVVVRRTIVEMLYIFITCCLFSCVGKRKEEEL